MTWLLESGLSFDNQLWQWAGKGAQCGSAVVDPFSDIFGRQVGSANRTSPFSPAPNLLDGFPRTALRMRALELARGQHR
jgi:hypothetical protein